MTWGEQTDVPESADWYNAGFLILWGSNVPQTRTPDAHFYTEVRYKGTKSAVISPDYAEATKFADLWLHPKQGTDAALAMAIGHVILREYHLDRTVPYFEDYARQYTDLPMLVRLVRKGDGSCRNACCAPRFRRSWARPTTPPGRRWRSTRTASPSCLWAPPDFVGASKASGTSKPEGEFRPRRRVDN